MKKTRRRICYVSGTRADFGLMRRTLLEIQATPGLALELIATGMHLPAQYGSTISEIERTGLSIGAKVEMLMARDDGAAMAAGMGLAVTGMAQALENLRPDLVLLLGDRGEMLAGAIAATYMNLPIAHIHGGEVSGNTDDSVRHAISKLAHLHLPSCEDSAVRLRRMGESPSRIFVVGAPGLDEVLADTRLPSGRLLARYGLAPERPYLLILQHPVIQEMADSARQLKTTLEAASSFGMQCLIGEPNSDAGRSPMLKVLEGFREHRQFHVFKNLPRTDYLSLLAGAKLLLGNSSSGIIEAPSLGLPVVNVGTRQQGRQRGKNVIDVPHDRGAIIKAIKRALSDRAFLKRVRARRNPYGDGKTSRRIARLLHSINLDAGLLKKRLAY